MTGGGGTSDTKKKISYDKNRITCRRGSSGQGPADAVFDPGHGLFFLHDRWKLEIPDAVECDYYNILYAYMRRVTRLVYYNILINQLQLMPILYYYISTHMQSSHTVIS